MNIVKSIFSGIGSVGALLIDLISVVWKERKEARRMVWEATLRQILFTGFGAIRPISIIALLIGAAIVIQSRSLLPAFGAESALGSILVAVVVRELGPLLTAFIVIGRSGNAICTEIGYMKVGDEITALESLGINPLRFIVWPRIVGAAVAIVCLSCVFNIVALAGGYLCASAIVSYPVYVYLQDLGEALTLFDVGVCIVKCGIFGVLVSLICSWCGFSVNRSITEIPQATSKAIVVSLYACFIANVLITILSYI